MLYLINDSYDPLTYRQLRIALNKNKKLLAQFEHYCGYPIAEIPDPFGCHESYSRHFTAALLDRLHCLDIHPVILDTYRAYQSGYYNDFIAITLENYSQIQAAVATRFDSFTIHNLLHFKCPQCQHIEATYIHKVSAGQIHLECKHCNKNRWYDSSELQGKLSWKLDCAARWNLYKIDVETFSKIHLAPTSTFYVAQFLSEHFYGGCVPVPVKYGAVQIDKEISYRLIQILPPVILKKLFLEHFNRDIKITKDSVENFCHRFSIQPGVSYIDYVHKELPKQVIRTAARENTQSTSMLHSPEEILSFYGKHFARFYYDRDHSIGLPDLQTIATVDTATARAARDVILYALAVRAEPQAEEISTRAKISQYLTDHNKAPAAVVRYIRRILGQPQGPRLSMLLTLLPDEYLQTVQMALSFYANMHIAVIESYQYTDSARENAILKPSLSKTDVWMSVRPDSISPE